MILIDSDVLLIEHRYHRDKNFALNQQALQQIQSLGIPLGVTSQVLLEVIGVLSFNVSPAAVPGVSADLINRHCLVVIPDLAQYPTYANCSIQELVTQMSQQMALSDAVQAVQIAKYASSAQCLLTWNARHFRNKLAVPVLTPEEWLNQRSAGTPSP